MKFKNTLKNNIFQIKKKNSLEIIILFQSTILKFLGGSKRKIHFSLFKKQFPTNPLQN
jgi:hypothetical protein